MKMDFAIRLGKIVKLAFDMIDSADHETVKRWARENRFNHFYDFSDKDLEAVITEFYSKHPELENPNDKDKSIETDQG